MARAGRGRDAGQMRREHAARAELAQPLEQRYQERPAFVRRRRPRELVGQDQEPRRAAS